MTARFVAQPTQICSRCGGHLDYRRSSLPVETLTVEWSVQRHHPNCDIAYYPASAIEQFQLKCAIDPPTADEDG